MNPFDVTFNIVCIIGTLLLPHNNCFQHAPIPSVHRKKLKIMFTMYWRIQECCWYVPFPPYVQTFFSISHTHTHTHTHLPCLESMPHLLTCENTESACAMLNVYHSKADIHFISLPLSSVHGFEAVCY